eukprot:SAG31_NODE_9070_length_1340_cov_1.395649_1_plen_95_part_00
MNQWHTVFADTVLYNWSHSCLASAHRTYFFLNTATMMVIPWIAALTLLHWAFFVLTHLVTRWKERLANYDTSCRNRQYGLLTSIQQDQKSSTVT